MIGQPVKMFRKLLFNFKSTNIIVIWSKLFSMPSHQPPSKKILLALFLGACFLWAKKDLLTQQLPQQFTGNAGFPAFGPLPMMQDVPVFSELENVPVPVTPSQPELSINED